MVFVPKKQVIEVMKKMAKIVDEQNQSDANYNKMSDDFENSMFFFYCMRLSIKGAVSTIWLH